MRVERARSDGDLVGKPTRCCDRPVEAGDAVVVTGQFTPRLIHVLCVQRATEREAAR